MAHAAEALGVVALAAVALWLWAVWADSGET